MTAQTVWANMATTTSYWFQPIYSISTSTSTSTGGLSQSSIQEGIVYGTPSTSSSISVQLDDDFEWIVQMDIQNGPPVQFVGLDVTGGGNLFELLEAQGWTPPA